jgi:hypothetical protein
MIELNLQNSKPAPPTGSRLGFYAKADGFLYTQDVNGTETQVGAASVAPPPSTTEGTIKASTTDLTLGFLDTKLLAGSGITLAKSSGPNEAITISANPLNLNASDINNDSSAPGTTVADSLTDHETRVTTIEGNYVTTDTTQTITGAKTFDNDVTFNGAASSINWTKASNALDLNDVAVFYKGIFNVEANSSFIFKNTLNATVGSIFENSDDIYVQSTAGKLFLYGTGIDLGAGSSDPIKLLSETILDSYTDTGSSYGSGKMVYVDPTDTNKLKVGDIPSASGQVDSVVAGNGIAVDNNDPVNPITSVNKDQGLQFNQTTGALKLGPHYLSMAASGVYHGGTLSVSTPTPDGNVNISALEGFVIDTSNFGIDSIDTTPVSTNAIVHPISAGSLVNNVTYILIDSTGSVIERPNFPTPVERRTYIFLGVAVHPDNATVQFVNNLQDVSSDITGQLHDLSRRLGFFNIDGNGISANGANLSINKAAGTAFKTGVNYSNNSKDPDTATLAVKTASQFKYRTQTGNEDALYSTDIDTDIWDDGSGNNVAIPGGGNQATIQRIYVFPSNEVRIQAGQTIYSNVSDAIDAIGKESFVTDTNIKENGLLLCQLVVRKNATDLSDSTQAVFFQAGRFGEVGSVGSALTGTLQNAYDNSIDPEIITDSTRSALTVRRGSAADTDNVIEVQNGAGTVTASIRGDGVITGENIVGSTSITSLGDLDVATNITVGGTVDGRDIAADGIALDAKLDSVVAGTNITIVNTDPQNPIINLSDVLNLASTTNASPTDGDIWFDSTSNAVTIEGDTDLTKNVILSRASSTTIARNDTAGFTSLSGGTSASKGAEVLLYGSTAASVEGRLRINSSTQALYDADMFQVWKKLNLKSATNSSPVSGDLWYDGSATNVQGSLGVSGNITVNGPKVIIDAPLANSRGLDLRTAGVQDWLLYQAGSSNDLRLVRYNTSGVFQGNVFTIDRSTGDATFNHNFNVGDVLNLGSTTNASPVNGDIWYDGTDVNIQGVVKLNSQKLSATNFVDLVDTTGWGVRVDGSNDSFRPLVTNDTELGLDIRRWSKVWATDGDFSGDVQVGDVLKLSSTTNASPTTGDIWYDGTELNIQGILQAKTGSTTGEVKIGSDTGLTTNNEEGYRVRALSGSVFIDHKTHTGGTILYRCGQGTETGQTRTFMSVNPSNADVTFSGQTYFNAPINSNARLNVADSQADFLVGSNSYGTMYANSGDSSLTIQADSTNATGGLKLTSANGIFPTLPSGTASATVGVDATGKLIQFTGGGGGVTPGAWTNVTLASNISVRSGYRPLRYRSDGIDGVQVEGTCKYNTGFNLAPGFTVVLFTFASGSRPNNDFNVKAQVGYNGSTFEIDAWAHIDASTGQVTLKNSDAIAISELYDISFNFRFSLT